MRRFEPTVQAAKARLAEVQPDAYALDGDVASNHLSWQWVAGTGSTKPYLFNADNVAKYAPVQWHSPGTVIDTSYEALDQLARSAKAVSHLTGSHCLHAAIAQPALSARPPGAQWSEPDGSVVVGRNVWLIHPWSIGAIPPGEDVDTLCVGVGFTECHAHTPWNERRWSFVTEGMQASASVLWWGSARQMAHALRGARSVGWQSEPHADVGLNALLAELLRQPSHPLVSPHCQASLFEPVETYCHSFSQWWRQTEIRL